MNATKITIALTFIFSTIFTFSVSAQDSNPCPIRYELHYRTADAYYTNLSLSLNSGDKNLICEMAKVTRDMAKSFLSSYMTTPDCDGRSANLEHEIVMSASQVMLWKNEAEAFFQAPFSCK